jgi:probable HAF family extracellular repeat protein
MQTRSAFLALLGLSLLSGCGGGGGRTPAVLNVTNNRDGTTQARYAVTDLGAISNYYYGGNASPTFGVHYSMGILGLNNKGLIVSGQSSRATVYRNGEILVIAPGYSSANAINDAGQAVGDSQFAAYYSHATLYYNGNRTDLGTLAPSNTSGYYWTYSYSSAYGINSAGVVVGDSQVFTSGYWSGYHAFVWFDGAMSDIGTLGGDYSRAVAINRVGKAVGWSSLANSTDPYNAPVHAATWFNQQTTDLGTLPGGTYSDARGINEAGQIVGNSNAQPQGLFLSPIQRAVTWIDGKIMELGTLGGPSSAAYGINNAGQIVGSAETTTVDNSASYYGYPIYYGGGNSGGNPPPGSGNLNGTGNGGGNNGGGNNSGGNPGGTGNSTNPIGSGAIGRAAALHTRGIGDTYVAHAYLYSNGKMDDLNGAIDPKSGWELVQAAGINDVGQVVGFGLLNKRIHAFLLTPQ